ncbi:MAG TPA: hypothetical protein VMF61_14405, partial [Candidatus Acidoferrales bacterium]|nr:hypothetical protein [Candidatus Acidoferrales bacterium]
MDDVHLAAADDLDTLDALILLTQRQRLVVLACLLDAGSFRVPSAGARIAQWVGYGATNRTLSPLDDTSVELLVRAILHDRSAQSQSAAIPKIVAIACGNPRYAIELAEQASSGDAQLVPQSARAVVDGLRRSLPKVSFELLLACSVVGERFRDDWIGEVCARPLAAVANALQEGCDRGILAEDVRAPGWFSFRHPALRNAVYRSTVSLKRRLLHERVVERLKFADGDAESTMLLAGHYEALRDRVRAGDLLTKAADAFFQGNEFEMAGDLYERAANHAARGSKRWLALSLRRIECLSKTGRYRTIVELIDEIRLAADLTAERSTHAELLWSLLFALLNDGNLERVLAVVDEMAAVDGAKSPNAQRASAILAGHFCGANRRDLARPLMESLDPQALSDAEGQWRYLMASTLFDASREPLGLLLERAERAAAIGARLGRAGALHAYVVGSDVAMRYGDLARAEACAYDAERSIAGSGDAVAALRHEAVKVHANVAMHAGDTMRVRDLLFSNFGWRAGGKYNEAIHAAAGVYVGMRSGDAGLVDAFFDPELLTAMTAAGEGEICGLLLSGYAEVMHVRALTGRLQRTLAQCVDQTITDPHLWIDLAAARFAPADALPAFERRVAEYERGTIAPIAPAHAALFRAVLARRRGKLSAANAFARDAAKRYDAAGWRLRQASALEITDPRRAVKLYAQCGAAADASRVAASQTRKMKRSSFGARL